jgi:hypothetical protein
MWRSKFCRYSSMVPVEYGAPSPISRAARGLSSREVNLTSHSPTNGSSTWMGIGRVGGGGRSCFFRNSIKAWTALSAALV